MDVSIAMITYNQEKFIRETIESVINQEFENEYEIIIGDDGSQDGTLEILRQYEQEMSGKIKVITHSTNVGAFDNLKDVVKACTGNLIFFIDGDDLWEHDKLKTQCSYMKDHPECMISFHNGVVFESETKEELGKYNKDENQVPKNVIDLIEMGNCFFHSSKCIRRELVDIETDFAVKTKYLVDWNINLSHVSRGKIGYINADLGRYRIHPKSISQSSASKLEDVLSDLLKIAEKARKLGVPEPVVKKRIARNYYERACRALEINNMKMFRQYIRKSYETYSHVHYKQKVLYLLVNFSFILKLIPKLYWFIHRNNPKRMRYFTVN